MLQEHVLALPVGQVADFAALEEDTLRASLVGHAQRARLLIHREILEDISEVDAFEAALEAH